jgi:L-lactate dehydrogenase complex protein LldG
MSTRSEFMNALNRQAPAVPFAMPELAFEPADADADMTGSFVQISSLVGGRAVELKKDEDINALIRSLYPEAANIASNHPAITIATVNPDSINDPHALDSLDLSIVEGEIGVAENGCVWIPQRVRQKVIYFISEYLVILLDKHKIVPTMHEGYLQLSEQDYGFGVFISGPSKTADIEQALVVGAHGARGVTVILK